MTLDINSPAGAGLIGAGAQLGSGLLQMLDVSGSAHRQRKMMRYQRDMNLSLMDAQNAYNMAMYDRQFNDNLRLWNMQNEYNSPLQQKARLQAAGYNPYALLGNSGIAGQSQTISPASMNGVSSGSVGMPATKDYDFNFVGNTLSSYLNTKMQFNAERESNARATMAEFDSRFKLANVLLDISSKIADNKLKMSQKGVNDEEKSKLSWENTVMENTYNDVVSMSHAAPAKMALEMKLLDANEKEAYDRMATNSVQRLAMQAGIHLSAAQAYAAYTSADLNKATTRRQAIQALGDIIGNGAAARLFEALPADIEFNQGWFHRYVQGTISGLGNAVIGAFTRKGGSSTLNINNY